ncbi:MAG: Septum formation initiator [Candidatus Parcubacteria bacterium]|jgi:cell division protein FtsB
MRDGTQSTGRIGRLLGLKRVLVANLVVFAVVGWGFSGEYIRNREAQKEVDRLKAQADELEAKNAEIADLGKRASTADVLEREARLKLNLRKPGEQVVVVEAGPGLAAGGNPVPARAVGQGKPSSNLARWWKYFFR